jgi:hypothetical protein
VLVEARPSQPARIEVAPLAGGRPLRRLFGTLDELERQADDAAGALATVAVTTLVPTMALFDLVQQRLPKTVLLDVEERCATAPLAAVEANAAEDAEPSIDDLFREYLAGAGAADANNERIASYFGALLHATQNDEPFDVPRNVAQPGAEANG